MATLELTAEESLVLFEFLSRFSTDDEPIEIRHRAEEIVLWNMCGNLEKQLVEPFDPNYEGLLAAARRLVSGEG